LGIYDGVRSSDLENAYVHTLAEYIAQAQRLVDTAAATDAESKRLVSTALGLAEEFVRRFESASAQLGEVIDTSKAGLMQGLDLVTSKLADAGEKLVLKTATAIKEPAAAIKQATATLLATSAAAEANLLAASDERTRLAAFKAEVDKYLTEVMAHERESARRIAEAEARMYAGAGFLKRALFVFAPPTASVRLAARPARPALRKHRG